jgi:hypothetical protein
MRRLSGLGAAVGLLLWAVPAVCDYSLSVWATAQGGGKASNQTQDMTYAVGQASPVGMSSNASITITSGLVTLFADILPPVIQHSPPAVAVPERTALGVTADIGDNRAGVEAATVFYREGGLSTYRQKAMTRDGSTFTAEIPPSAVTERGLLYYIQATDFAGNSSQYPQGAPDSLVSVRVRFEDLQSAFEMPAGQYRMISLPGSTNGTPDDVLVDDLGPYDHKVWRLGRWNPAVGCSADCYDEYPAITDMDRGKAFWLITRGTKRFDFSGVSTLPERPFRIHMERGWNQIGTPFAFGIDWLSTEVVFEGGTYPLNEQHVVGSDTIYVEDNLVSYDGTYHGHQSVMEPWHGYWLYNGSTREVDLQVNPAASALTLASSPAATGAFDVLMELALSSPDFPERTALAGLSPEASDGWDGMDHREPPPIGDHIRLVFDRPEWGNHRGLYMTDIRHSSRQGAYWAFRVETTKSGQVAVDVIPRVGIPQGWDIFLYDQGKGLRVGIGDLPYRLPLETRRDLSLIAGTEEFVRRYESEGGIALRAQIVSVAPNPFAGSVSIAYFTPEKARAELEIYSVEGRLVKAVDRVDGSAGIHKITWDGRSDTSAEAAPGLYFARLRIGHTTETAKILKIK